MAGAQETQLYCLADRTYYDTPGRLRDRATRYPLALAEPPAGWRRTGRGLWTVLLPDGVELPEQGWKIHVSTVPAEAERTLAELYRTCVAARVPFKFLRSAQALRLANGKHMPRGGSGKFAAVYPGDEQAFLALARELSEALDGRPGPYVLTDLRIGRAPVYARYGAFVELWCQDEQGRPVPALRAPTGELVPDRRDPVFRLPAWVTLPEELRPHLAARQTAGAGDLPYLIREALQFSNAGGIYLAEHRETGERVVLREARPHAGLDAAGDDALTRLHREDRALRRLAGLDCVPKPYGVHTAWEHTFLATEYIEGVQLFREVIRRYPLVHQDCTPEQRAEYVAWVDGVVAGLEKALGALHERGVRFGDLHPANVLLRPDGSVALVDFEYADELTSRLVPRAGAPGLQPPPALDGAEADRYMLWATWLMMLMPIMEMADREPAKLAGLERRARTWFGLGPDAGPPRPAVPAPPAPRPAGAAHGEDRIRLLLEADRPDLPAVLADLVAGIHAGATPERADRLFPGDPAGFTGGGTGVAHGAAGVLYALHRTGARHPAEYTDWLVAAARRTGRPGTGGLLDGPLGTAVVLAALGRREDAAELAERGRHAAPGPSAALFGGRAGAALARLRLATALGGAAGPDEALLAEALADARALDAAVRGEPVEGLAAPEAAGLLYGVAGLALLHLRLHRQTGEPWLLDAARVALERARAQCVRVRDGSVQVKDGKRHLVYLDRGSSGIALVAQEYLAARPEAAGDPAWRGFSADVRRACAPGFLREPGLFRGRCGLTLALDGLDGPDRPDGRQADVLGQVRRLGWHLVSRPEGLLVPGTRLRRFSADLHTGAAGVLLALHTLSVPEADSLLDVLTLG
ncbi:class III lanthionine synthetase LanKC [Kitasatospora sp. NPDC048239]|uniref:class III lanthionine synthetase LanKC n=1 Tax=Kitasatospora sp. NPDC048239 TaxID=3364046 RepID=UPI00371DBDD6